NAGIADDELVLLQIPEGLHLRASHRDTHIGFGRRRADPRDLERIKTGTGCPGQRSERRVAGNDGEHGAILRRNGEDVVGSIEAAAARHVLWHDVGIARQMLADIAGDHAAPGVIATAGPEPDDHGYVLAREAWSLRGGWQERQDAGRKCERSRNDDRA